MLTATHNVTGNVPSNLLKKASESQNFRPENRGLKKVKPLKTSCDFFSGFLFKPVVKNVKVDTTIGAQEGTRTPTKLLAST